MKITDGLPVQGLSRKQYRRGSSQRARRDELQIAGDYIAQVPLHWGTKRLHSLSYFVSVVEVDTPKPHRLSWLFPGVAAVQLMPIDVSLDKALEEGPASANITKSGRLWQFVETGFVMEPLGIQMLGYLLPKDRAGDAHPTYPPYDAPSVEPPNDYSGYTHDPDVKAWHRLARL
jgi:hypothetical protein